MKNGSSSDPDHSLWGLIRMTNDAAYKVRYRELSKFGISTIESRVLRIIQTLDVPVTPSEITRRIIRAPHSVSGLLNRMEKEGLVKKTRDLEKKNMVRVSLTKKGLQAYRRSLELKSIRRILSGLSDEQRQQLASCLEILLKRSLKELGLKRELPFP